MELDQLKKRAKFLLIQFGSERCIPCVSIKEKIEMWNRTRNMVKYVYLPIEEYPEDAAGEGIFSVPSVIFYIEGKMALKESGYFSVEDIFRKMERYISVVENEIT